jgi:hypothetical protein
MCVKYFSLQLKAAVDFQDVNESQQFYFATTGHVTAWMRSYGSSRLMEFF